MSGGSYNYLYFHVGQAGGGDDWPREDDEYVREMLSDLAESGYGESRVARDLRQFVADVARFRLMEETLLARGSAMVDVLRAIEWERSGDMFEADAAIAAYEAAK